MKRTMTLLVALGLGALATNSANAVTTLIGGSTNNGNADRTHAVEVVPAFFLPQPDVWVNNGFKTLSGPYQDDLDSEPWAGPAPTPVTTDGSLNPPPPDGCDGPDCGVFFKAFGGNATTGDLANGILYQDNPATAGLSYYFSGWAGAEAGYSGLAPATVTQSLFRLSFLDSSNSVISSTALDLAANGLGVANGQPFNYKLYQMAAVAPAGTVTVRASVEMLNGYNTSGGQAFVADDFTLLGGVPEPTTVALGLLGMIGMFGLVRRR